MRKIIRPLLALVATVIITSLAAVYFIKERNLNYLGLKFTEMAAFNEVSDIESFDEIEDLIEKCCKNAALEYISQQRAFSLLSIKHDFLWGETVKDKIKGRSPEIYERALKAQASRSNSIPSC